MKRIVVDASFAGAWFLTDELNAEADVVLQQVAEGGIEIVIPSLWHYEIANLLGSARRRKRLSVAAAEKAANLLQQIPLGQVDIPDSIATQRILGLAQQHHLSAYDAAYLELSQRLGIPLLTADHKLRQVANR